MESELSIQPNTQKTKNKQILILLFFLGLILVTITLIFNFYFKNHEITIDDSKEDFLILNVPYYGTFTAEPVASAQQAIINMILGYWGDTRYSLEEVFKIFPIGSRISLLTGTSSSAGPSQVVTFFQENGYEVRLDRFDPVSLDTLEQYLKKGIPVVVSVGHEKEKKFYEPHLLIGIAHSRDSLIFHTQTRGNNYEIPFSDFIALLPENPNILIINPLESTLKEPYMRGSLISQTPYPQRLGIMDSSTIRNIQMQLIEVSGVEYIPEKILLLEKIVYDPGLDQFRPDGRLAVYIDLATAYIHAEKFNEAINLLITKAMPLNHDLDSSFNEWPAYKEASWQQGQWHLPWLVLGEAYYQKNEFAKAREAFNKALEIHPQSTHANAMLLKIIQAE